MILNRTITTGGAAQDFLADGHAWGGFILTPLTEDCWVQVGANAAVDSGEKVFANSPTKFSAKEFPEFGGRWSIYSATTGAKFTIRPIS